MFSSFCICVCRYCAGFRVRFLWSMHVSFMAVVIVIVGCGCGWVAGIGCLFVWLAGMV